MTEDKKKYNYLESTLQNINQKFISISKEDELRNNEILNVLVTLMTDTMKKKDCLFKEMFMRVFHGGSYYDGLRVGQPDEFDLDLLLALPKMAEPTLITSNVPGFVNVKFNGMDRFNKQADLVARYKNLSKLIAKDNYLDVSETLKWMESVVQLALNEFKQQNGWYVLDTRIGQFQAKIKKSGPAFTLQVKGNYKSKDILIDIDLVPCFVFQNQWLKDGFKPNPVSKEKPDFFIVPKPLKGTVPGPANRYWRLSFQEQERVIMDRKEKLKPAIKLLKKLRDKYDHKCIASYYLKTVVLWQAEKREDSFWKNSLSYVFITMLKEYLNCLNQKCIPYFWYKSYNLIGNKESTITVIANTINGIVQEIEKSQDPSVITKHLLTKTEQAYFSEHFPLKSV